MLSITCCSENLSCLPFKVDWRATCPTTAIPTGRSIMVVAVFEIHIDKNAEAIIKPRTIRFTPVPIKTIIHNARRL